MSEQDRLHMKLKRRLVIECSVETQEPLHIGKGRELATVSGVDMPVMKDVYGNPVIPGSGLRGAFRAHVSRLLKSVSESILKTEIGIEKVQATEDEIREFQDADTIEKRLKEFCSFGVIDKLFGAPGFASPLRFSDALGMGKTPLIERTHIRIDANTDRVAKLALFDAQATSEKRSFGFRIFYDELSDPNMVDANMVFYKIVLKSLALGTEMFLGGMKSRGYGLCTIKAKRALVYKPEDLALAIMPTTREDVVQLCDELASGGG